MYKFGDWVMSKTGMIGIVVKAHSNSTYFVKHQDGSGTLYTEEQLQRWVVEE